MKSREEYLNTLEDVLVKQFRKLQSLISITREERQMLSGGAARDLLDIVEQKESILDELSLLEENRRLITGELCQLVGLAGASTLTELIPHLETAVGSRLHNLHEGISKLVDQARHLNMGNQALAQARTEWLAATQAFLLSFYQPPTAYQANGSIAASGMVQSLEIDQKA